MGGHPNVSRFNFRAYDKVKNILIKNIGISCNKESFLIPGNEVSQLSNNLIIGIDDDNYIIVQSTGMLDKNKVEIFEGDVIEILLEYGIGTFIVRYSSDYGSFIAELYSYSQNNISIKSNEKELNSIPLSVNYGKNPAETVVKGCIFDSENYIKFIRFLNKP